MHAFQTTHHSSRAVPVIGGAANDRQPGHCAGGTARRRKPGILIPMILSAILAAGVFPAAAAEEVVQIRITHRDVSEVLSIVQPLVSPYGFISADVPSNSLIVIDQPVVVERIRALVSRIDQPVPQLKIRVQYGYDDARQSRSASVEGRVEAGDATIGLGETASEGIEAEISSGAGQRQSRGDYIVMVRSGSSAYIRSGYDVPYPERWLHLSRKYGHIKHPVTFKRVDTGYDVRPVLVGEMVQIEITPRISYLNANGLKQPIRFAEAATRLNVPLGQWVEIAATNDEAQEVYSQILGAGHSSGGEHLSMRLMVTRN